MSVNSSLRYVHVVHYMCLAHLSLVLFGEEWTAMNCLRMRQISLCIYVNHSTMRSRNTITVRLTRLHNHIIRSALYNVYTLVQLQFEANVNRPFPPPPNGLGTRLYPPVHDPTSHQPTVITVLLQDRLDRICAGFDHVHTRYFVTQKTVEDSDGSIMQGEH